MIQLCVYRTYVHHRTACTHLPDTQNHLGDWFGLEIRCLALQRLLSIKVSLSLHLLRHLRAQLLLPELDALVIIHLCFGWTSESTLAAVPHGCEQPDFDRLCCSLSDVHEYM